MEERKVSQSINISGSQLPNTQIGGQAGHDFTITQSQQIGEGAADKTLTPAEVSILLDQLKELLQGSNLSESDKEKAIRSVETAKDEVQTEEPDRDFAAKNLKKATAALKEAGETVEAGTSLWQKINPILKTVSPWLGKAVSFFI